MPPPTFRFQLTAQENHARSGQIHTARSVIQTPVFMPVGTHASVKTLSSQDLQTLGIKIILANAYHLDLRPGASTIAQLGGLHHFMKWPHTLLTDSGGFQRFSLKSFSQVQEEGLLLQSPWDGSKRLLTPEDVVHIQLQLGSDVLMCLDDLASLSTTYHDAAEAMERTTRWAKRCLNAFQTKNPSQNPPSAVLFGIVQGGLHEKLRYQSAQTLQQCNFSGYALGGLSIGETPEQRYAISQFTTPLLPAHKPRYAMGIGTPEDLLMLVSHGIDMFDCVMPTRNARNGTLFTSQGKLNIKQQRFRQDPQPLDEYCQCQTCQHYSRAYLHHLFRCKEISALRLFTLHNLYFFQDLMQQIQEAISHQKFQTFQKNFLHRYQSQSF